MQAGPFKGARGAEDPFIMANSKSEPFSCNAHKKQHSNERLKKNTESFVLMQVSFN